MRFPRTAVICMVICWIAGLVRRSVLGIPVILRFRCISFGISGEPKKPQRLTIHFLFISWTIFVLSNIWQMPKRMQRQPVSNLFAKQCIWISLSWWFQPILNRPVMLMMHLCRERVRWPSTSIWMFCCIYRKPTSRIQYSVIGYSRRIG